MILKYSADEARNLKSYGEFPDSVKINETVGSTIFKTTAIFVITHHHYYSLSSSSPSPHSLPPS